MKAVDLKATALVTGSPIFGTPTLRQVHRLIAEPLVANGPVFNETTKSRKRKGRDAPSRKRAARFAEIGPSMKNLLTVLAVTKVRAFLTTRACPPSSESASGWRLAACRNAISTHGRGCKLSSRRPSPRRSGGRLSSPRPDSSNQHLPCWCYPASAKA